MITKRWCTKCGTDPAWWLWRSGEHVGCGGRVIPIATICNPPEPTTIDESDLAPGMVVVAVDEIGATNPPRSWICTPDAHIPGEIFAMGTRNGYHDEPPDVIRYIAGPRRPC